MIIQQLNKHFAKHLSSSFLRLIFSPTPPHLLVSASLVFTVGYTQSVPIPSVRQQAVQEVIGQHATVSFGCSLHLAFPPLLLTSCCSTAPACVLHSLQSLYVYLPWHKFSLADSPSGVSLSWCGSFTGRRSSRVSLPHYESQSIKGTFSSIEHVLPREQLQPCTKITSPSTCLLHFFLLLQQTHLFMSSCISTNKSSCVSSQLCFCFSFYLFSHVLLCLLPHVCPSVSPPVSPFCDSCPQQLPPFLKYV